MKKIIYSKSTKDGMFAIKDTINSYIKSNNITELKPLFLVGVSGGSDSLALLFSAFNESKKRNSNFRIAAVVVNHKLQKITDKITDNVVNFCNDFNIPVYVKEVNVKNSGEGLEAGARLARYNAIEEVVKETNASGVLLGHTMNDNAEQVFLGLLRGSGSRSISGIAEIRDNILRPFLKLSRTDTEQICMDNNLEYWVDPHNSVEDYTRVKIRKNVIPLVAEEVGFSIVKNLAKTAEISREDADTMDWVVNQYYTGIVDNGNIIKIDELTQLPIGLQKHIIRKFIIDNLGGYGKFSNVNNIMELLNNWHGQKYINVENGFVWRVKNNLYVSTGLP